MYHRTTGFGNTYCACRMAIAKRAAPLHLSLDTSWRACVAVQAIIAIIGMSPCFIVHSRSFSVSLFPAFSFSYTKICRVTMGAAVATVFTLSGCLVCPVLSGAVFLARALMAGQGVRPLTCVRVVVVHLKDETEFMNS